MHTRSPMLRRRSLAAATSAILTAALLTACAADTLTAPVVPAFATAPSAVSATADANVVLATLRRVTARYHDLDVALADGFTLLHPCEARPGEGPVGAVYYHPGRLMDGQVNPELPDALIYEPSARGRPKLVGVEFAVPDVGQPLPTFQGATFQREAEFGVLALHAWVWRENPAGMFAETNPRVSCGEA